jgi:cytochrome P450
MTDSVACPALFPMPRACPYDPPPELARLQRQAPVSQVRIWNGSTPWLLTRYNDVRAALADPRVSADPRRPGYPHTSSGAAAQQQRTRMFIEMDDPEHAAQRRLVAGDFTLKRMRALRPRIQQLTDELLDALLEGPNPTDLVAAFALPLPLLVICELLGVPYGDRDFLKEASTAMVSHSSTPDQVLAATEDMLAYLGDLTREKCQSPTDDLLSRLAVEQLRPGLLDAEQIASLGQLLLVAGHETTANMIALGTLALLERPGQFARIGNSDTPQAAAGAVEELLRYFSVLHSGRRLVALPDLEIGGQCISSGQGIIAALDIANRDQTVFPDADTLDLDRDARRHLASGHGVHQCLGQSLTRIELQIAYHALARRIPTLTLAADAQDLQFREEAITLGVCELPVSW